MPLGDFKGLIAEWVGTWPPEVARRAPAPDARLLHPVCDRYPVSWLRRALELITRDIRSASKIRNPGSVLYSAAKDGWLKYFPEDPPRLCELCDSVPAYRTARKCPACLVWERGAAGAEAGEGAGRGDPGEVQALNDKLVAEYGITVPGVCRVIKQHKRTDLLALGIEGAARVISGDPHLRRVRPGPPGCPTCESGPVDGARERRRRGASADSPGRPGGRRRPSAELAFAGVRDMHGSRYG